MTSIFKNTNCVPDFWIESGDKKPTHHDALLFKAVFTIDDDEPSDWVGSVRGLYQGRETCVLVLCNNFVITMAPMVENGFELAEQVSHWAPWPKVAMPIPMVS